MHIAVRRLPQSARSRVVDLEGSTVSSVLNAGFCKDRARESIESKDAMHIMVDG